MDIERRSALQLLAAGAAAGLLPVRAGAEENSLFVIAELVAKPEKADVFRAMLVDFVAGVRKEPGCKHYALLEDPAKPGRFLTFEKWTDKAALEAHLNTPEIKAMGPKLQDILAAAPVITPLKMLSSN